MPIPHRFSTPLGTQRLDPHLDAALGQRPSLRGSSNDRVSGSTAAPKVSPVHSGLEPFSLLDHSHSNTMGKHGKRKEEHNGNCWFKPHSVWKHVKTARTPHLHEVLNQVLPAKSLQGLSPILRPKTCRPGMPRGRARWGFQQPLRCQRVVSLTRPKDSMQPAPLDPLDRLRTRWTRPVSASAERRSRSRRGPEWCLRLLNLGGSDQN